MVIHLPSPVNSVIFIATPVVIHLPSPVNTVIFITAPMAIQLPSPVNSVIFIATLVVIHLPCPVNSVHFHSQTSRHPCTRRASPVPCQTHASRRCFGERDISASNKIRHRSSTTYYTTDKLVAQGFGQQRNLTLCQVSSAWNSCFAWDI